MRKIVAIMPVSGRIELLPITIKRLLAQRGVDMTVWCCVDTLEEDSICRQAGACVSLNPDISLPLGNKFQSLVEIAGTYEPDAIMIVGSGNWFTDNWCEAYLPYLNQYDLVGALGMLAVEIRPNNEKKMICWHGYAGSRHGEPIGAGRLISARILNRLDWKLFDVTLDKTLDRNSKERIIEAGGKILGKDFDGVNVLKVSSYKWPQTNSFVKIWQSPMSDYVVRPDETLKEFGFTEAINLFE